MIEEMSAEKAQKLQSTTQDAKEAPPPDRVCVTSGHPHFFKLYRKIGVKFNGKVIFDVEEYCVSEGWVRRQLKNGRGQVIRERGVVRTITYQGVVEPYWR